MLSQYGDQVLPESQCPSQNPTPTGDKCGCCGRWSFIRTNCRYGYTKGSYQSVVPHALWNERYVYSSKKHQLQQDIHTFLVKHFDISLPWMGKYKNWEKAAFWSADTDEGKFHTPTSFRGTPNTSQ